jgi:hypothetical protein
LQGDIFVRFTSERAVAMLEEDSKVTEAELEGTR